MPTIIPNSATIVSIYPSELEHQARHNGLVTYKHPAAMRDKIIRRTYSPEWMSTTELRRIPPGEPFFRDEITPCPVNDGYSLITVYDTFTWTRDFTQDQERFMPNPLPARRVADSLVTTWASDVIEGNASMGPGIAVIEGETPTLAELKEVRDRQTRYARTLINSAQVMSVKKQDKDISDLHRNLAAWMGVKDKVKYPWIAHLEQYETKHCKACGEDIRVEALRCKECNVDLVDFYVKHGIVPDQLEDPAVFDFISRKVQKNKVA